MDMVLTLAAKDGLLFSGSYDSCCRVWSTDGWRCVQVMQGHADAALARLEGAGDAIWRGSRESGHASTRTLGLCE